MYQYNLIQCCNTLPFLFLFLFFQELLPLWNLSRTSKFLGNFSSYSIFDRWRKKKKKQKKDTPTQSRLTAYWPPRFSCYGYRGTTHTCAIKSVTCGHRSYIPWPFKCSVLIQIAKLPFPVCKFGLRPLHAWNY